MLSSQNDDDVGGLNAAIRAAMFAPQICRRSRRNAFRKQSCLSEPSFRRIRRKRLHGEHRCERSEPLDRAGARERSNQKA
jgi:hypothetical protein